MLGLSIDSVYSHIGWMKRIEEKFGVQIPFPIIADADMKVAKLFGMIHEGESSTEAVRAVLIMNPEQKLRAILQYSLSNGRNIDEIIRLIDALQTSTKHGVATPANWRLGDAVIVPPPLTKEEADKRLEQKGMECRDWFFCTKKVS